MESTQHVESNAQSSCAVAGKGRWLSSRNVLIGAVVVGGAALFFGWDWLVAAGVASVIVGVLPCLAMCAAGLCMGRMGKKDPDSATTTSASLPPQQADNAASSPSADTRT